MNWYRIAAIVLLTCWITPTVAPAIGDDKKNDSAQSSSNRAATKNSPKARLQLTMERQAAARTFVKQHHAELAELLIQLEENHPNEYQRALRDLYRTSERLAQIREKDQPRYKQELSLWKVRSRIQLVTAKIKMKTSPKLEQELEAALNEEIDLRVAVLMLEKKKLASRMSRLDKQLKALDTGRSQTVKNKVREITSTKPATKTTNVNTSKNRPKTAPAKNPSKTTPTKTTPAPKKSVR
jgi:hypothetical protein